MAFNEDAKLGQLSLESFYLRSFAMIKVKILVFWKLLFLCLTVLVSSCIQESDSAIVEKVFGTSLPSVAKVESTVADEISTSSPAPIASPQKVTGPVGTPSPESSPTTLPTATKFTQATFEYLNSGTSTVNPEESSEILINPGKGWLIYGPFDKLASLPQEVINAAAACYTRYEWARLEPREDLYTWSMIDNDIEACARAGLKLAFGIMTVNTCTPYIEVTPEWVFDAGASYTEYTNSCRDGKFNLKAPVWHDPVYKAKMQDFINALKERYDGNPDIAFIDNRTCGNWGEWHSFGCDDLMDNSDKVALVDMYSDWDTPIVINALDGTEDHFMYGIDSHQYGCRHDSSNYVPDGCAYAYDKSIAVSEWETSYSALKTCSGWSGFCWSEDFIADYMSKSRYSYDNMGQWFGDTLDFYNENSTLVEEWANKMGYWFRITEVIFPNNLGNGSSETIKITVRNDGVAPIYTNIQSGGQTYVKLALLDNSNEVLAVTTLHNINPYHWKPFDKTNLTYEEEAKFEFPFDSRAMGIAIGLFTNESLVEPDIKLGIEGRLSSGWYPLN
jgi:hypothetical protein